VATDRPTTMPIWPTHSSGLMFITIAASHTRAKVTHNSLSLSFLRVRASSSIARISYGNSVCLSVTTQYQSRTWWDRTSGFLPHDSLESLVFCHKISCCWVKGVPPNEGVTVRHPLKKCYITAIGLSTVKLVADRHRHAAYHHKHWWQAS